MLVVTEPFQVDLAMQPASLFRPHIKVILKPTDDSQVALTALIDSGSMCSFIREACVPKEFYIPTKVSFGSASGSNFYSNKITRPIEIQPFMIRHGFFAFDYLGEDILLGTDFLSLVGPFAFFPEGFSYTIHSPMDGTSHVFQVPWVEKYFVFGEGRKFKNYPIYKYEPQIKELLECCAEVPNQF